MKRTYVDVHVIQDLPPSNVNRDDNGTPKQATYGGVDRLRVSSQAWKRATRKHFESSGGEAGESVRTRRLHGLLSERIVALGGDRETAAELTRTALAKLKITADKKNAEQSSYLLFAGREQIDAVARALLTAGSADDVDVAALIGSTHPLGVALFGRMVADMTMLNVDAAAQVAHAISTHAAPTQFDYFTAVDDEQEKDEAGAGMIGTVEFNSATLYRFATVGLEQLVDNMGDRDAAVGGIARFITSFALSLPSGHQNSFAALTRPHLLAVVVRDDQPVNLVSAFEAPVRARSSGGYVEPSLAALARTFVDETSRWGDSPRLVAATYTAQGKAAEELASAFGPSLQIADVCRRVSDVLRDDDGRG